MLLDYSITLKQLDRYVDDYNATLSADALPLKGSMLHTAKEIVRMYGRALLKASKHTRLQEDNLPSMRANNVQLSKITKMSSRTIQRHLKRLLQTGIITKKINHGSKFPYELWITPKILWIKGLTTPKKSIMDEMTSKFQDAEKQEITNDTATKCPHRDARNYQKNSTNKLIGVDNFKNTGILALANVLTTHTDQRSSLPRTTFSDFAGYPQLKAPQIDPQLKAAGGMMATAGWQGLALCKPGGAKIPRPISQADVNQATTRHTFLLSYAKKLYGLARQKLYADTLLTPYQHQTAIALLYQWYRPVPNEKLARAHEIYCDRIELARKYIARKPQERFVTLPDQYFDPKNKNGFAGTKRWYQKHKIYLQRLQLQSILRQQIQKFKRNEAKDTGQGRPRITVLRECQQEIDKLKIPALAKQFESAVQHILRS
ncbi:winged helix-turn-helix domain-containing protein [Aquimarina algicola]|uniref:Winged helix-turn-helix transcriptional regulator n=1 Tax=Aquimarina algicola TaxID=2589995 RepID=A0A504JDP2_9FLAO|nr:winged helix-turn-helix domain-containing protein [Aquimarina algicola]TPN85828.1 winged helix-turn-helix transcriptional regulator [Aquimarina algicola]